MRIRPAMMADLPAINAIYNHYVLHSTATYQTEPSTPQQRLAWFEEHDPEHPVLVMEEAEEGEVIGWGALSRFHPREAFARTVEDSIYLRPEYRRKGLGRAMLGELMVAARGHGHRTIVAVISADQVASVKLHAAMGFTQVGLLREVGHKFGQWLDAAYMQLLL